MVSKYSLLKWYNSLVKTGELSFDINQQLIIKKLDICLATINHKFYRVKKALYVPKYILIW